MPHSPSLSYAVALLSEGHRWVLLTRFDRGVIESKCEVEA